MAMSKRVRFEVFKRDDFRCQYCGRQTPSVILQIDHIVPRSQGGSDEINNLVTSCTDCNLGKSNVPLWKKRGVDDRIKEIELLRERQEQIEWYEQVKRQLKEKEDASLDQLNQLWSTRCNRKFGWSDNELRSVREFLKFLTPQEVSEAIYIAAEKETEDEEAQFRYFCGICHNLKDKKIGRQDRTNYRRIKTHFLSYRRSQWYRDDQMRMVAKEYALENVLEAIDSTMSDGLVTGGYWSTVMWYLENEYEPKTAPHPPKSEVDFA